ncbi:MULTISPECIES: DUF3097 domain-containing protein [Gordonia]|uniref:DUF3097 domain-containing protein n=2 Tax=Gordonia TaxID=2053 RepID=A0A9X3I5M4_9ACTN|nr:MULTISPECIES: DUF3097 domain-containing protein [Gordonia]MAU82805.1 hypothetical protein [Gordonia sp. (in: high G+C Gram-positive bacteria)]MCF3940123.1 DUF3097 domain-containing protein [Gordonia tangerina]MCX2965175.1 DUF3097 domain-containing protein [Gordonia aquimaris]
MSEDRYGRDVLANPRRAKPRAPEVAAERDLVVEDAATGFCGAVVGLEKSYSGDLVRLEDRHGITRVFLMHPAAFLIDGRPVTLVRPRTRGPQVSSTTASGSRSAPRTRARTARASRIFVEGVHDATLLERVWGDDLRAEGVVVESLDGLDNLAGVLAEFGPAPHRRAGVLVDHLVAGSKEMRLTGAVGEHVLVCGHPFIDVWEAVKPASVRIEAWPQIPRGIDWKTGICSQLRWGTPQDGWRRVLAGVNDYRDLEVELLRSVEELIDFVTAADGDQ